MLNLLAQQDRYRYDSDWDDGDYSDAPDFPEDDSSLIVRLFDYVDHFIILGVVLVTLLCIKERNPILKTWLGCYSGVVTLLLLVSLLPMPIDYYKCTWMFVSSLCFGLAYWLYSADMRFLMSGSLIIGVIFLRLFEMPRSAWICVDLIAIALIVFSTITLIKREMPIPKKS